MTDETPPSESDASGEVEAPKAPPLRRAPKTNLMAQAQRDLEAATQLQTIKAQTLGQRTFRARNLDPGMAPLLLPGDILEIGGANPMKIKANDFIYYRLVGDDHRLRKVVRRRNDLEDVAFVVCDGSGKEDTVLYTSILGVLISYERDGQIVRLQKEAVSVDVSDLGYQVKWFFYDAWNRIRSLFDRNPRR